MMMIWVMMMMMILTCTITIRIRIYVQFRDQKNSFFFIIFFSFWISIWINSICTRVFFLVDLQQICGFALYLMHTFHSRFSFYIEANNPKSNSSEINEIAMEKWSKRLLTDDSATFDTIASVVVWSGHRWQFPIWRRNVAQFIAQVRSSFI